jgi:hypothetical protein
MFLLQACSRPAFFASSSKSSLLSFSCSQFCRSIFLSPSYSSALRCPVKCSSSLFDTSVFLAIHVCKQICDHRFLSGFGAKSRLFFGFFFAIAARVTSARCYYGRLGIRSLSADDKMSRSTCDSPECALVLSNSSDASHKSTARKPETKTRSIVR